jgi:hypothetical protein
LRNVESNDDANDKLNSRIDLHESQVEKPYLVHLQLEFYHLCSRFIRNEAFLFLIGKIADEAFVDRNPIRVPTSILKLNVLQYERYEYLTS